MQGVAGPDHGSSAHHRDRRRILPLSQNPGGTPEKESIVAIDGVASTLLVQRKGLNAAPSSGLHPGWRRKTFAELDWASLLLQVGPNVSIAVGPNQVVKRTGGIRVACLLVDYVILLAVAFRLQCS